MSHFPISRSRTALRAIAIVLAFTGSTAALADTAADAATDTGAETDANAGLREIVVTAQKRETNLQNTPIAISVLDGEDLRNRGVKSLTDLMDGSIPSLRIAPFATRTSALTVGIRGIVPFDANQPSRDAGVGIYIDGVYLGRSQGLGSALYDIDRIEVLKGPQGTLFGRNSTGGAVSIVTRKPSGEFSGRAVFGMGNYGSYKGEVHLDLPEWNNFSVKLDGIIAKRDGTIKNPLASAEDFNKYDKQGLHVGVRWTPFPQFEALYNFDISREITTPFYIQLLEKNPAAPALAKLVQVQADRAKVADIGLPQQDNPNHTHGHMLSLSWKPTDEIELRSISSYRKLESEQLDNGFGAHSGAFTANATFARYSMASLRQKQWSQEVQLLGNFDKFNFVGGFYYYHEKGDDDAWTPNTARWNADGSAYTFLPTLREGARWDFPDRASTAKADSLAFFGQATWTPIDILHITGGARWTKDKKSGALYKVNGADTDYTFKISGDRIDPMVTIALDPADGLHLYGKWSTAYRAGGANSRSVSYRAFDEETVETWEVGFKSEFLDRRARLNIAAWKTTYNDIQIDFNAVNLASSNRGTIETVNAPGKGKLKGIEVDLTLAPIDGLTLTAAYAYTDAKLPRATNPFTGAIQNVYIVYTPKNAASASIDYSTPLGGATFKAHLDAALADGYRSNSGEATKTDSSFIVNGRLGVADIPMNDVAKLGISIWARNLLNEQHVFYKSHGAYAAIGDYGIYNEPRTFGAELSVSF